ncbi:MAG: ATPase, T2SS/T4P/T4SS family [Chthoniobacteraceae bacterium]|nr:ATPase, T2SS/T4P/T4SS family [Chthoniobacteraceae bacterium]
MQRKSLIEILFASGVDDPETARALASLRPPGGSWTHEVLNSGKVDEIRFTEQLGILFGEPVELLNAARLDRSALSALPSRFVFKHHILPLAIEEQYVRLATCDVFNNTPRQLASQLVGGKRIEWTLVPRSQLLRAIKSAYGVGAETFEELLLNTHAFDAAEQEGGATDLNADGPEASVVKFVNQILREALFERATDIHIEPLDADLRIRYRIDGILHEVAVPPQLRVLQSAIISRLKVMARMDIAEKRLPQDGRINLQQGGAAIDVRVSTIPTVTGESVSLRLLNRDEARTFGFERLDLSDRQSGLVRNLLREPNGIILVTGPTGSGKSTTLYSLLSNINSVERRIVTIEEPVEYRIPGVSQIDVKPEIGLTFASGLRAILRQDPNVVMVGEIRDVETAEIAIRAAMTGHLVFSTLHTNDAVGGITRLLDMGVEPFLVASVVRAFVAQRLVRTVCPDCAEPVQYPGSYLKEIGFPIVPGQSFRHGRGCESCRQTGYRGRAAIYEFCAVGQGLRNLIIRKSTGAALKTRATHDGMETLRQDGWRRVLLGQTTVEEVLRVTQSDEGATETD